ncbi:hypothetical protein [Chitinophaga sp. GbtcB8]|uniref:hypothetical protein n=1 Tax=Chitinophaga sp. GbtcB8 TaxID=2824753 RepID=UPI001C2FE44A|nr:hypothetical protein [Chitinophaga sp. GbtcB8]
MQQINKQIADTFTGFLRGFVSIYDDMDENDLILAYENLFNHQPIGSLIKNNRLAQTVEYLKEVMAMHQLTTLDGLIAHYNRKKTRVREFLTDLIQQTRKDSPLPIKDPPSINALSPSLYKNTFLKLHHATAKALTVANRPFHLFINALYRRMYITDHHFKPKEEYMGISVHFFVPVPVEREQVKGFISSVYLEQFYEHNNNRPINLIQLKNQQFKCTTVGYIEEHMPLDGWTHFSNRINIIFEARIEILLEKLLKKIKKERPVKSEGFKKELVEWLYYSKLRDPGMCENFFTQLKRSGSNASPLPDRETKKASLLKTRSQLAAIINDICEKKLSLKKWAILKSPSGHSWVTSDNAGFGISIEEWCKSRQASHPDTLLADIKQDTVIYFPLSKDYCLRLQPYDLDDAWLADLNNAPITFEQSSEQELTIVNRLTYATHKYFVVAGDIKSLELCNTKIRAHAGGR